MKHETRDVERLLHGYSGRVFLTVTFAFFALKIGQRLLPPLLPVIIEDLAISPFAAGLALSVMAVTRAGLQFPSGRYSDRLSRKTILLFGAIAGLVGLCLITMTHTYVAFLVGVAILGSGQGLYEPAARALLSDIFIEKRGRAFGIHILAGDIGGVIAAGLAIVVTITWRPAFLPSIFLLVLLVVLLTHWSRETVVFQRVDLEFRETARRHFAIPRIRWALVAYALIVFAGLGITSFLAAFLVSVHGFSIELAGTTFILLYGAGALAKPTAGWLSDRMSRLAVVGGGVFLGGTSLTLLTFAPSQGIAIAAIGGYAFGQRGIAPPFQAYLMDQFPEDSMGGDLGAVRSGYIALGSLGPSYMGFIAGAFGYTAAYASMIFVLLGAAAIAFRLEATGGHGNRR